MSQATPPLFVAADDLYLFKSVEEAESWLEPVDVEPGRGTRPRVREPDRSAPRAMTLRPAPRNAGPNATFTGTVVGRVDGARYSFLRLETESGQVRVAVPMAAVASLEAAIVLAGQASLASGSRKPAAHARWQYSPRRRRTVRSVQPSCSPISLVERPSKLRAWAPGTPTSAFQHGRWKMRLLSALLALLSLAFSLPARADNNATTNSTDAQSLRAFVQEFYDWYGANILSGPPGSTWERVRKERKSRFSPQIIRALDENAAAQASVPGDTVGLDFDPFVASQDSDERYEVGKVTKKGEVYFVNVHGVHQGRARAEPTVVAELEGSNGLWRFRNFHYQHGRELLALLKSLQVARGEGTRHPGTRPGDP